MARGVPLKWLIWAYRRSEDMNDIDKWAAEQCGVEIFDGGGIPQWKPYPRAMLMPFTIQDSRCREIVRERFQLRTLVFNDEVNCYDNFERWEGVGKTIAEAEIACITAIWEARDE